MFFKNLTVYRMTASWNLLAADVNEALAAHETAPIGASQQIAHGWERQFDDQFVHVVNRQMLLLLKTEKKVVPSSALKAEVASQVERITEQTGRKPGKKETRELKDEALLSLLPNVLPTIQQTHVWIDPVNGWIVVNTGSPARADVVINHLIRSLEKLELQTLHIARDPGSVMTEWLLDEVENGPARFSIDRACELKANDETKAVVKYTNSNLNSDDLHNHIKWGKRVVNLALTFEDRVSFVLTERFRIKKVQFLDLCTMEYRDQKAADERESHDVDFTIMTIELNNMLNALIEALGGEMPRDQEPAADLF